MALLWFTFSILLDPVGSLLLQLWYHFVCFFMFLAWTSEHNNAKTAPLSVPEVSFPIHFSSTDCPLNYPRPSSTASLPPQNKSLGASGVLGHLGPPRSFPPPLAPRIPPAWPKAARLQGFHRWLVRVIKTPDLIICLWTCDRSKIERK